MKLKNVFLLLAAMTAGITQTGCKDNDDTQDTVLKPMEKHIMGKWNMVGNSIFVDGKWEEQDNDNNTAMTMEFRADGTEVRTMTRSDGFTTLASASWEVDNATNELKDAGKFNVYSLTADELIFGANQAYYPETGEMAEMKSKWFFKRIDTSVKTLAEQMVGKWHSKSYEKVDGEWKEITFGVPDVGMVSFLETGFCKMYSKVGEMENTSELMWSVNGTTNELRLKIDGREDVIQRIEFVDENSWCNYYDTNTDHTTGEVRKGEFKDVMLLVKE